MTPREIFIYIMLSIIKDPTLSALDITRRTAILEILRRDYCPSVTDDDWASIQREIDKNQPILFEDFKKLISRDDMVLIYTQVVERFKKRK